MRNVFIFLMILSSTIYCAYAKTYTLTLDKKLIESDKPFILNITPSPPPYTKIRPIADKYFIEIYNETTNRWVSSNDLWASMPIVKNNNNLKVISDSFETGNLKFVFLNTMTNQVYESGLIQIYSVNFVQNYINKINDNVNKYTFGQKNTDSHDNIEIIQKDQASYSKNAKNKIISYVLLYLIIMGVAYYLLYHKKASDG